MAVGSQSGVDVDTRRVPPPSDLSVVPGGTTIIDVLSTDKSEGLPELIVGPQLQTVLPSRVSIERTAVGDADTAT